MALSDIINQTNALYYARFQNTAQTILAYVVVILKSGYAGAVSEIEMMGPDPLQIKHNAVEDNHIKGTEVIFNIMSHKNDFDTYDEVVQGEDFEYELLVYDQNQVNWPIWRGFISPGDSSRDYFSNYTIISISATDYLARLKDIEFTHPSGVMPITRDTALNCIGWILEKLGNFQGVYAQCNLVETNFAAGEPLHQAYIYPKIFAKLKNGIVVGDNCYDVLNYLGRTFGFIVSSPMVEASEIPATGNPRFFISAVEKLNAPFYWCSWSGVSNTMAVVSAQTIVNNINIDTYKFSRDSEFNRNIPFKTLTLIQHNYDFGETFTTDDFSDLLDTTVWDRTNLAISGSAGDYSGSVALNTQGRLRTHNAYILNNDEGNRYISVKFKIKNTTAFVSYLPNLLANLANNALNLTLRIIENTGTEIINHDEILLPIWAGAELKYISPINANFEINPASQYLVNLLFNNTTSARAKSFDISEMQINTVYGSNGATLYNVMFDNVFEGILESKLSSNKDIEIKIGDSDAERNASAITFSADDADITSDWTRYGKGETKSIQELILQSYFNRFSGKCRQLRLKVYDPTDVINLHKFILFDSDTWFIQDYEKDLKSSWVTLLLQRLQTTDVSITVLKKFSVQAASGASSNSSSASGGGGVVISSGGGVTDHGALTGLGDDDHLQYKLKHDTVLNYLNDGDYLQIGKDYTFDAFTSGFTVYLPPFIAGAKIKFYLDFVDDTHQITIDADGESIDGESSILLGAVNNQKVYELAWNDTESEWKLIAQSSLGCTINGSTFSGIKTFIETDEVLKIPENWDYNTFNLSIDGLVECDGILRIL